jgi:hypothetical protein
MCNVEIVFRIVKVRGGPCFAPEAPFLCGVEVVVSIVKVWGGPFPARRRIFWIGKGVTGGLHIGMAWNLVRGPQELLPGCPAWLEASSHARTFPFLVPGAFDNDVHLRAAVGVGRS